MYRLKGIANNLFSKKSILICLALLLWSSPHFTQEKANLSKQNSSSHKHVADYKIEGRQGIQMYFVDETSIAEIYPKLSSKPKNVKSKSQQNENSNSLESNNHSLDSNGLGDSSLHNSGKIRIVSNKDKSLISSLKNRNSIRKNAEGASLSPVFQHSISSAKFVLAGGIEVLFPDHTTQSNIETWLLSKGLRGQAIFPGSKLYIVESEPGYGALDLANQIANDPLPLEVTPVKSRTMSLK
ncbi:MAG: hypothetical protein MH321_08520 [Leptospiraceae bacterium]|nr:hypothetical protein [Leptospiraceae bacterium]